MTHEKKSKTFEDVLEVLIENGFDEMGQALTILFNEAMKIERSAFLDAKPFERTESRRGYANGFKPKRMQTRLGEMDLQIPQVRNLDPEMEGFYPKSLERGLRSERALKLAVAEMYVNGISTRRVVEVTRKLCGLEVNSSQVSRATRLLDDELAAWRTRPLGKTPYLILDARYEKVRHGGSVIDCAVLLAVGVREDGKRSVLGVSVSLSEAEAHWRDFLKSLQDRGLHGVEYVVSDDHKGLRNGRKARLTGVIWQRCQFHLQQNAMSYVPKLSMRKEVAAAIRSIFNAESRDAADRRLKEVVKQFVDCAPRLANWMEENIPEGLTVFELPPSHRTRLRTSNCLESLSKNIKRRTRVAGLFPNEASVLRLVSAILVEITEEWESGKVYLNMESQ